MARSAPELSPASAPDEPMEFEQPLSERMRTFLRIEFLYQQALYHAGDLTGFSARAAISSLLEITAILGRGDVRSEVMKELERHTSLLTGYARQRDVDLDRVSALLANVDQLRTELVDCGPQFLYALKECEFLNMIKHRSSIPGGTCMFDLPDYAYWLRLPIEVRIAQFDAWTKSIRPVCDAVEEVLWLTRQANEPVEQIASGGMYQHQMDRNEQPTLLRVIVSPEVAAFPEISAGKHRFTVRFVTWEGIDTRPSQVDDDVPFRLALC
ncbi:MAG TPA: cell division protein ZapD [Gammaproteobacteria bacterium]